MTTHDTHQPQPSTLNQTERQGFCREIACRLDESQDARAAHEHIRVWSQSYHVSAAALIALLPTTLQQRLEA